VTIGTATAGTSPTSPNLNLLKYCRVSPLPVAERLPAVTATVQTHRRVALSNGSAMAFCQRITAEELLPESYEALYNIWPCWLDVAVTPLTGHARGGCSIFNASIWTKLRPWCWRRSNVWSIRNLLVLRGQIFAARTSGEAPYIDRAPFLKLAALVAPRSRAHVNDEHRRRVRPRLSDFLTARSFTFWSCTPLYVRSSGRGVPVSSGCQARPSVVGIALNRAGSDFINES